MSRRHRQNRPAAAPVSPTRASESPSAPVAHTPPVEPVEAPVVAPADAPSGASPEPVVVSAAEPPASPSPRFVAVVRIHAGSSGTFAPGEEIPEHVAHDGLREGEHWRRG